MCCDDVVCACPSPNDKHRRQGGGAACCNNKIYLYMRKNANTVNRCSDSDDDDGDGICASDSAAVFVCLLASNRPGGHVIGIH